MNKIETVEVFMDAIQQGDLDDAKSMLADDFQFGWLTPTPINKDGWLEMSTSLKVAFPDLDYRFRFFGATGDVVRCTSQLSGTHSGALDLTNMNMGVIPATNKAFSAKLEELKVTVRDNKITSWIVEPTESAGLMAILKQLEVLLPIA